VLIVSLHCQVPENDTKTDSRLYTYIHKVSHEAACNEEAWNGMECNEMMRNAMRAMAMNDGK
jgi:hypothetical protein